MGKKTSWLAVVVLLAAGTGTAVAQDTVAQPETSAADQPAAERPIAATVNGSPIFVSDVEAPFAALEKSGRLGREDPRLSKARILAQIVDQRIVAQALEINKSLYSEEQVERHLQVMRDAAQRQGTTIEALAASQGLSFEVLRQEAIFRVAMENYLKQQLPEHMPEYIERHKAEYDGTEVRASHIMLRPLGYTETQRMLIARANAIREEITSGKIGFGEAAKQHSQAPSSKRGGDLGFMPRRGAMLEAFSAALFKLKPGEISEPVATPLGVHLIQAVEVKPGDKIPQEAIPVLQQQVAAEIFKQLADQYRPTAKVEYTGKVPYFKSGIEELATP